MPLSDEEQRTLEQIETALLQDDPEFTAEVSIDRFQRGQRRILAITAIMFVTGAALLIAGLVTTHEQLWLGVLISLCGALTMGWVPFFLLRQWRRL